jgi:hypothetical protein
MPGTSERRSIVQHVGASLNGWGTSVVALEPTGLESAPFDDRPIRALSMRRPYEIVPAGRRGGRLGSSC